MLPQPVLVQTPPFDIDIDTKPGIQNKKTTLKAKQKAEWFPKPAQNQVGI
jgi:hypothetical protein